MIPGGFAAAITHPEKSQPGLFENQIVDDEAGKESEEIGEPQEAKPIVEDPVHGLHRTFGLRPDLQKIPPQMPDTENHPGAADQQLGQNLKNNHDFPRIPCRRGLASAPKATTYSLPKDVDR